METIIFTVTDKLNGLLAINYICDRIKGREDANNHLKLSHRLMGMYRIFNDTDDREIIFCPVGIIDKLEGKNVIDTRPCMWFVGASETKEARVQSIIDWLLNKGGILSNPDS